MQKLKSQGIRHLSDGVLKILTQNRITTIYDFLEEDISKLSSLTRLNLPEILAIRSDIFEKYSAPLVNGTTLLTKVLINEKKITTGIKSLDAATCGGIPMGCITELCGLAESGKSQLSFQVAINCVKNTERTVLYVDTKGDFSAIRIQQILGSQNCSNKEMASIMYKIKVVYIWTMDELVELFRSIKNKTFVIENLALVIVDSLPCLMFQYLGDENKMGLSLLNTLVNYSRFVGNEFNIGIVYINIQTRWIDSDICEEEDNVQSSSALKEHSYVEKRNRCLGRYWEQIPALVLILEVLERVKETFSFTQIKVSVMCSNNVKCHKNECTINLSMCGIE
ncbi:unnamed protein product [Arctia plantaginis]|uniref:RecA family profile 1 domain-containing protein n=1 Tax=Arctia plantaginis TaxID=874455 RepID=A0A8S0ZRT3_ARCPL|nr:unnamed protein product [Arctia plantaginis]